MNLYFYLDAQNQQHGPISVTRFAECGVSASTLIWCQGMDNWTPASAVPEVREWFEQHQAERADAPHGAGDNTDTGAPANGNGGSSNASYGYNAQGAETAPGNNPYATSAGGYAPRYNGTYIPCPPTHLVWAILSTICCCLPLGIVAIVKSCQVSTFYAHGRYDEALIASDDARRWSLYALMAALLVHLLRIAWALLVGSSLGLWGLLTNWGMLMGRLSDL